MRVSDAFHAQAGWLLQLQSATVVIRMKAAIKNMTCWLFHQYFAVP
jgi:hypothetical protein